MRVHPQNQGELDLYREDDSDLRDENVWRHPEPEDFHGTQMQQYRTFIARDTSQKRNLSNSLSFWDRLPKYSIPLNQQQSMRNERGDLPDYEQVFEYGGREFTLVVCPARVKGPDGLGYEVYPSEREQLIEAALRYLACQQATGFYTTQTQDIQGGAGVVFSIYQVRRLLEQRGRHYKYREIRDALKIMRRSVFHIRGAEKNVVADLDLQIIEHIDRISDCGDLEDSGTRWIVRFNHHVARAITSCNYRQFDFDEMVRCKSMLARWLYQYLVHCWRNASPRHPSRVSLLSVRRDSGSLPHKRLYKAAAKLEEALDQLVGVGVVERLEAEELRGARNKLLDVHFTLYPTRAFTQKVIDANMRQRRFPPTNGR
jgi:hypothetical protein